jgi:hypothetical protein
VAYVGTKGTKLFQRVDRNPGMGWSTACISTILTVSDICLRDRQDPFRGAITEVNNNGHSIYHALQFSATKRLSSRYGTAITAAYTWSHMIDNTSEIFGPGVVRLPDIFSFGTGSSSTEVITPFPQNSADANDGERGNSSFDRRHRLAISYVWVLPSPDTGAARALFGNWQFNGFFTYQSGQPFTPLNAFGRCRDANGDGIPTNDRPNPGNPNAPVNSVALLNNTLCFDPANPLAIATPSCPAPGPTSPPTASPSTRPMPVSFRRRSTAWAAAWAATSCAGRTPRTSTCR